MNRTLQRKGSFRFTIKDSLYYDKIPDFHFSTKTSQLQLKPVPNYSHGDDGRYVIELATFTTLIPHWFVLEKVYRQEEGNATQCLHFQSWILNSTILPIHLSKLNLNLQKVLCKVLCCILTTQQNIIIPVIICTACQLFHPKGDLITAVHETSLGFASEKTQQLLSRLSRTLPPGPPPVNLYAEKIDVEITNSVHLLDLPGIYMLMCLVLCVP